MVKKGKMAPVQKPCRTLCRKPDGAGQNGLRTHFVIIMIQFSYNVMDLITMQSDLQNVMQKMAEMQVSLQFLAHDAEPRTVPYADSRAVVYADTHAEIGADACALIRAESFAEKFAPMQIILQIHKMVQNHLQMSVQFSVQNFVQKTDLRGSF